MDKLKPKIVKRPFQCVQLVPRPIYCDDFNLWDRRISCQLIDIADEEIYREVTKAAHEAGIDDLYLMDKQFVLDALREKLEREGYGKR